MTDFENKLRAVDIEHRMTMLEEGVDHLKIAVALAVELKAMREQVERLGYALLYTPCHDHVMNWNYPLVDDGPDGTDGAGLEWVRSWWAE